MKASVILATICLFFSISGFGATNYYCGPNNTWAGSLKIDFDLNAVCRGYGPHGVDFCTNKRGPYPPTMISIVSQQSGEMEFKGKSFKFLEIIASEKLNDGSYAQQLIKIYDEIVKKIDNGSTFHHALLIGTELNVLQSGRPDDKLVEDTGVCVKSVE